MREILTMEFNGSFGSQPERSLTSARRLIRPFRSKQIFKIISLELLENGHFKHENK